MSVSSQKKKVKEEKIQQKIRLITEDLLQRGCMKPGEFLTQQQHDYDDTREFKCSKINTNNSSYFLAKYQSVIVSHNIRNEKGSLRFDMKRIDDEISDKSRFVKDFETLFPSNGIKIEIDYYTKRSWKRCNDLDKQLDNISKNFDTAMHKNKRIKLCVD